MFVAHLFVALLVFLPYIRTQQCTYFIDSDININPINYQPGSMDDCCKICEYTTGCQAFTWSGYNGGTCWLKAISGPTFYSPNNIVGILNTSATITPPPPMTKCSIQVNMDIPGNNLINIPNSMPGDCCSLCYVYQGCKAYSWSAENNGTCWLKSASGPMTANNDIIAGVLNPDSISWTLNETYNSSNFYGKFDFFTDNDPTHGYVDFVNQSVAQQLGLISTFSNGTVYMGADHTNVIQGDQRGRPSIRLTSKTVYNGGLFIFDLTHMPVGPGTWPAYWFVGPDWPNNGETDILEGIGGNTKNGITLHTADGCAMRQEYAQLFTGTWADGKTKGVPATDCFIQDWAQQANEGCSIQAADGSYGDQFNSNQGGVYAFEWEKDDFMRVWIFPRNNIPSDITQGSPNPSNWGKPSAFFHFGSNCPAAYFNNMNLVFDLTFCGDWAGSVYPGGNGACIAEVQNHPENYTGAYWAINYIKVYQNGLESCKADGGACSNGGDCCSGFCFNGACH